MKVKNFLINMLKGLYVWVHCTIAELGVAFGVCGFYLTANESGYVAVMAFIIAALMLYLGLNAFAVNGVKFFPKKCKCNGKCQEHDTANSEVE